MERTEVYLKRETANFSSRCISQREDV